MEMRLKNLMVLTGVFLALMCWASHLWASGARFRILHIMSYHSPWEWTDDQLNGFKEALKGLDVEYKVFQMDTKRRSTREWKEKVGREARELIDAWKPDLVYTNDDNAQEYVARFYVNREIPFVFSGVNADPDAYGFEGSHNVTGILEQEHFVETVRFLREVVPAAEKIAVIVDDDPTWTGVIRRMKQQLPTDLPDIRVTHWNVVRTFKEYREKILAYQDQVDALGLLGIHTFKDEDGRNVPWQEVLKWTTEHSSLPDFSFWKDRVLYGTLCVVYVSGYQQGLAAGRLAREILVEGKPPSACPIRPTKKGNPALSLARARMLGIDIKSSILLTAKIVREFAWEE